MIMARKRRTSRGMRRNEGEYTGFYPFLLDQCRQYVRAVEDIARGAVYTGADDGGLGLMMSCVKHAQVAQRLICSIEAGGKDPKFDDAARAYWHSEGAALQDRLDSAVNSLRAVPRL